MCSKWILFSKLTNQFHFMLADRHSVFLSCSVPIMESQSAFLQIRYVSHRMFWRFIMELQPRWYVGLLVCLCIIICFVNQKYVGLCCICILSIWAIYLHYNYFANYCCLISHISLFIVSIVASKYYRMKLFKAANVFIIGWSFCLGLSVHHLGFELFNFIFFMIR
jgi:hypothetical protein